MPKQLVRVGSMKLNKNLFLKRIIALKTATKIEERKREIYCFSSEMYIYYHLLSIGRIKDQILTSKHAACAQEPLQIIELVHNLIFIQLTSSNLDEKHHNKKKMKGSNFQTTGIEQDYIKD